MHGERMRQAGSGRLLRLPRRRLSQSAGHGAWHRLRTAARQIARRGAAGIRGRVRAAPGPGVLPHRRQQLIGPTMKINNAITFTLCLLTMLPALCCAAESADAMETAAAADAARLFCFF